MAGEIGNYSYQVTKFQNNLAMLSELLLPDINLHIVN